MTAAMVSHCLALILFLAMSITTVCQTMRPVSLREAPAGISI